MPNIDEEDERLLGRPLTRNIIRCAIRVHRELGPGLLENVYRSVSFVSFVVQSSSPLSALGRELQRPPRRHRHHHPARVAGLRVKRIPLAAKTHTRPMMGETNRE